MRPRSILLTGFGAGALYFGGSLYCDDRNSKTFLETHNDFSQQQYLVLYQRILSTVLDSYTEQISKKREGPQKDLASKVENEVTLTILHMEQQRLQYDKQKLAADEQEWQKLSDKRDFDNTFFAASLIGLTSMGLWTLFEQKPEEKKE